MCVGLLHLMESVFVCWIITLNGVCASVRVCVCVCTYGQAVAEVVQAVPHDDHPGERGHAGLLEVLLAVALRVAVCVCVWVVVLGVVVVQDVVVVMVMVVQLGGRGHRVVEVGVAFVLAVG